MLATSLEDLELQASRIELLLAPLTHTTADALGTPPPQPPPSTLLPSQIIPKLQQLLKTTFQNNSTPLPLQWCLDLQSVLRTINTYTVPSTVSAFRPLQRPLYWPDIWLWPLSELSVRLTSPQSGRLLTYLCDDPHAKDSAAATAESKTTVLDVLQRTVYNMAELVSNKQYSTLLRIVFASLESERWDHHQPQ